MYAAMLNKKLVLAVDEACLVNARQKKLNRDNYHCPHCNKKSNFGYVGAKSSLFLSIL